LKIVFLCPNVPYPAQNGGHHRNLRMIHALTRFATVEVHAIGDPRDARSEQARDAFAGWGATLDVYPATGPGAAESDEQDARRLPDAVAHFRSPELAAALERRFSTRDVDLAHVEEVVMAQYLPQLPCPTVIDRQKVDWAYHEAMAGVVRRGAEWHTLEAARFRNWEQRLAGAFEQILVPGLGDQRLLEPIHGPGSVTLVPIGIGDELCPPPASVRGVDHVLLYGALDYGPNIEGQHWFFEAVWPDLKRLAPKLKVAIVGSGRPPLGAERPPSEPRVELHGFVPDVTPVLQGPGVLIVPVRVGGGARTKILEALACGMPVISTSAGIENLDLVAGRDFLLADSAAEMTAAIVKLVRDPGLALALGREGLLRAGRFRWSHIEQALEPIYRQASLGQRHRASAPPTLASDTRAETDAMETPAPRRGRGASQRRRTETWILRTLDYWLTPTPNAPRRNRIKGTVADLLARLARRR
jgi:polysaccharide biosynthesis protein PslH